MEKTIGVLNAQNLTIGGSHVRYNTARSRPRTISERTKKEMLFSNDLDERLHGRMRFTKMMCKRKILQETNTAISH